MFYFTLVFFFGHCNFNTSNEVPPKCDINQTALHILCRIVFLINLSVDFMQGCEEGMADLLCVWLKVLRKERDGGRARK